MKPGARAVFHATLTPGSRYDGQPGTVLGPGMHDESVEFLFDNPKLNDGSGMNRSWLDTQLDNLEPIPT